MNTTRGKYSKGAAFAAVLCILIALVLTGFAGAEVPVTVSTENLELTFDAGFSPKALSKTVPTPIALELFGQIKTIDGTHPPALREFILDADKNGAVDVRGIPACHLAAGIGIPTMEYCRSTIVGGGTMNVEVALPESEPILLKSALTIFNGGVKKGVTMLLFYIFLKKPVSAAVVTVVKIKKIHEGRFGTEATFSFPIIAGGSGSVTSFSATLNKRFSYKGKRVSLLTLKCPNGKIRARSEAIFSDSTHAKAEVLRPCIPKG
jgi:hypothetical protein